MPDFEVEIKQDNASSNLQILAKIGSASVTLTPGSYESLGVHPQGKHDLELEAITQITGNIEFRLDLKNAERPNGNGHIVDTGFHGYRNRLGIDVPEAQ